MAVQEIDVSAETTAAPSTVYALLRDGKTWPVWSPLGSFELGEQASPDDPEGLGAVRIFQTGRIRSRERIVELTEDRRFSYVLLEGLALKGYRADVELTPIDGGTRIRWHSTFRAKVPGMGWAYRRSLEKFIGECVRGLADYAGRTR